MHVYWKKKHNGIGMEFDFDRFRNEMSVDLPVSLTLYEEDRIAFLNVPFSEIYVRCSESQWAEIVTWVEQYFGDRETLIAQARKELIVDSLKIAGIVFGLFGGLALWILYLLRTN